MYEPLDFDNTSIQDNIIEEVFKHLESKNTYRINSGIIPIDRKASLNNISKLKTNQDSITANYLNNYQNLAALDQKEFISQFNNYTIKDPKTIDGV